MSIYMKAHNIKGSATAKGYEGWIPLLSLSTGVMKSVQAKVGNMAERVVSLPSFKELRIRKLLDSGSNDLFAKSVSDKATPQIEIHICGTDSESTAYYKLLLDDVIFTQCHTHVYEDVTPFESFKLNFSKIQQTYVHRDSKNTILSTSHVGYDLATAQAL